MIYLILLVLGLLIGAGFLIVLLIGDRKEARQAAQRKMLAEQKASAQQPVEGSWPPPPVGETLPEAAPMPPKPMQTRVDNRKMVRTFFQVRNWAIGVVVLAYIIYSCVPQVGFIAALLVTAIAAAVIWGGLTLVNKR